jgi:XTP/dITP diphosphohydrolase
MALSTSSTTAGFCGDSKVLVVATRNWKKRDELLAILGALGAELRDLTDWPDLPDVIEDGATFEANARKKASEFGQRLRQWTLGEDSGLVVPALGGRPGVHSARYAGSHGDDAANNGRLLRELDPLPDDARAAYYVCTVALADPEGQVKAVAEGRCHGIITRQLRGHGGFGYDPLFLILEYHRTFGELSPRVKQAISHRAGALASLRPIIQRYLKSS